MHAQPPYAAVTTPAPPTVWGVPLEPGERVLYYRRLSPWLWLFAWILGGIILLPLLVGIFFLYNAITHESRWVFVHVITDRRVLGISLSRRLLQAMPLEDAQVMRIGVKNRWRVSSGKTVQNFDRWEHYTLRLDPLMKNWPNVQAAPSAPYEA